MDTSSTAPSPSYFHYICSCCGKVVDNTGSTVSKYKTSDLCMCKVLISPDRTTHVTHIFFDEVQYFEKKTKKKKLRTKSNKPPISGLRTIYNKRKK